MEQAYTGLEKRIVKAVEVRNFASGRVEYWYDGEMRKSRPLNETDRQEEMKLKGGKAETPTPAPKATPGTDKACVATPGKKPPRGQRQEIPKQLSDRDRDIAQTHREETSKNGSYSALNGARG